MRIKLERFGVQTGRPGPGTYYAINRSNGRVVGIIGPLYGGWDARSSLFPGPGTDRVLRAPTRAEVVRKLENLLTELGF